MPSLRESEMVVYDVIFPLCAIVSCGSILPLFYNLGEKQDIEPEMVGGIQLIFV